MATHMRLKLRRSLTTSSNANNKEVKPPSSTEKQPSSCAPPTTTVRDPAPHSQSFLNNKSKPQYQPHLISSDPHFLTKSKSVSYSASSDSPSSFLHHQPQQPSSNNKICVLMEKQRPKKDQVKVQIKQIPVEEEQEEEEEPKKRSSSSSSLSPIVSVGGGRRKSFCDSKIELKEFLSTVSARIVAVDMPPFMQIHAVSCARRTQDSLEKPSSRILASTLKKEFDGEYGPAWHCIVGTSFGSFVTHSVGGFLYFSLDKKMYFLLFKTTVQKAD